MPRQYTKNPNSKTAKIIAMSIDGMPAQEIAKVINCRPDSIHSILSRWRRAQKSEGKDAVYAARSRHACLYRAKTFPLVIADLEAGSTLEEVAARHDISIPTASSWMRRHGDGWKVNDAGEFVPPDHSPAATYENYGNPDVNALAVLLNIPKQEVVKRAVALYKQSIVATLTTTNQ